MRQRTHLIVFPLAVVVAATAVLAFGAGSVSHRSEGSLSDPAHSVQVTMTAAPSSFAQAVYERVHIPIYQDANIIFDGEKGADRHDTNYLTPASIGEVISFYKDALPQLGWSSPEEHPYASNNLTATWIDPSQSLPWRVDVTLTAISTAAPGEKMPPIQETDTLVSITLRLYPDPSIIPIYHDAESVIEVTSIEDGLNETKPTTVTTTTYLSSASAQEIFSFYASALTDAGWQHDFGRNELPTSIPAVMGYNASAQVITSKTGFLYMHMTIGVHPAESGKLNVELTVRATVVNEDF